MSAPAERLQYLVYGKIIIDNIRLANREIARNVVGGGGPQGAFGARLWHDSVGFLSRSGMDIEAEHEAAIRALDIDLSGWVRYPDLTTFRNHLMAYDEEEYATSPEGETVSPINDQENWRRMMERELPLPAHYSAPRLFHLISEYPREPMMQLARSLQERGSMLSVEPIIDYRDWSNREQMLDLLPDVDVVSPDWPSASGLVGSDNPLEVMKHWSQLGPRVIAVRRGQYGSYVWDQQHDQIWHIPPVPTRVVDVTGAGNSYGGGLGVGWAESGDARLAGCYGAVSASFMVERIGLPEMTEELRKEAAVRLQRSVDGVRRL